VPWIRGMQSLSDEEKDAVLAANPARLLGL
jgi:hypothetical protein